MSTNKTDDRLARQEGETAYERIQRISAALFAKSGYQAVGVAEIGAATGLGRGALYHHIRSKEDLLFDIMSHYISRLVNEGRELLARESDTRRRIEALSRQLIRAVAENRAEMTVCFRDVHALTDQRHATISRLHKEYQQVWEQAVQDAVDRGDFRPVSTVALKGILGMYFYSFLWLDPAGEKTPDEIAATFCNLVIQALASAPEPNPPSL
ncbi:MAG: TetR/AcrR family transcriptional regulator [Kiloniellaceae bacterium]